MSEMLPLPDAAFVRSAAPPVVATVNVSLAIPVGKLSDTMAPSTPPGPLFVTTIVYWIVPLERTEPVAAGPPPAPLEPP